MGSYPQLMDLGAVAAVAALSLDSTTTREQHEPSPGSWHSSPAAATRSRCLPARLPRRSSGRLARRRSSSVGTSKRRSGGSPSGGRSRTGSPDGGITSTGDPDGGSSSPGSPRAGSPGQNHFARRGPAQRDAPAACLWRRQPGGMGGPPSGATRCSKRARANPAPARCYWGRGPVPVGPGACSLWAAHAAGSCGRGCAEGPA